MYFMQKNDKIALDNLCIENDSLKSFTKYFCQKFLYVFTE